MTTSREQLEAAIEAILFVSSEPVPRRRLFDLFDEDDRGDVEAALEAVVDRYRQDGEAKKGIIADFAAGGVRLVTRPDLRAYLRKYFQVTGRARLSMAALETLAIVAYRQPITAPEIQELRGVDSASVLKTLLDHRLVRIAGRKQVVGKPFLYCTSKEFLVRFGLDRLQDLPSLEELEAFSYQTEGDAAELAGGGTTPELLLWGLADGPDSEPCQDAGEEESGGGEVET